MDYNACQLRMRVPLQCLGSWLDGMPDPSVIAEGLTDMDTWLSGTLTPAITDVNDSITAYKVII